MSELNITTAQINRGALVAAFLDITLDGWYTGIAGLGNEDLPPELNEPLVMVVEALQVTATAPEPDLNARGNYLQGLSSLSDDGLRWVVQHFGKMPELL